MTATLNWTGLGTNNYWSDAGNWDSVDGTDYPGKNGTNYIAVINNFAPGSPWAVIETDGLGNPIAVTISILIDIDITVDTIIVDSGIIQYNVYVVFQNSVNSNVLIANNYYKFINYTFLTIECPLVTDTNTSIIEITNASVVELKNRFNPNTINIYSQPVETSLNVNMSADYINNSNIYQMDFCYINVLQNKFTCTGKIIALYNDTINIGGNGIFEIPVIDQANEIDYNFNIDGGNLKISNPTSYRFIVNKIDVVNGGSFTPEGPIRLLYLHPGSDLNRITINSGCFMNLYSDKSNFSLFAGNMFFGDGSNINWYIDSSKYSYDYATALIDMDTDKLYVPDADPITSQLTISSAVHLNIIPLNPAGFDNNYWTSGHNFLFAKFAGTITSVPSISNAPFNLSIGGITYFNCEWNDIEYTNDGIYGNHIDIIYTPGLECIFEKSRVLTPNGYIKVEQLHDGDDIIVSDGRIVPITKMHKKSVLPFEKNFPCEILAGTFAENYPPEDIIISPLHAVRINNKWFLTALMSDYESKLLKPIKKINPIEGTNEKFLNYYCLQMPNYLTDYLVINGGCVVESYGIAMRGNIECNRNVDNTGLCDIVYCDNN